MVSTVLLISKSPTCTSRNNWYQFKDRGFRKKNPLLLPKLTDILMGCPVQTTIQYYTILNSYQKYSGTRNRKFYSCKCVCGKLKDIYAPDIDKNKVVSCGCMTENAKIKDIPTGTRFGYLVVIKRLFSKSTEGYKHECQCDCGKVVAVYANRLKRGETKSCGCSSIKLNSLNNGGTGIPYETIKLQRAIRACPKYRNFVKKCLLRAKGISEFSGIANEKLCVHHLTSVSTLIEKHQLTIGTFMTCKELFSLDNAIVLTENEHRLFHATCGHKCITADWEAYSKAVIK